MMSFTWIGRSSRVAAIAAALSLVAAPAFGQAQPPPPAQPSPSQSPTASTGQAMPLSMEQAVQMALESNLGLKADRLEVPIADLAIASARSAFLPRVGGSFSRNTQEQQPQSASCSH